MRYHVLLEEAGREPLYFADFNADDDEQALRLMAEKWPGLPLRLIRQDGDRLVKVPPAAGRDGSLVM